MITLTKEWLMKTIAELEEERDATPGAVNEDAAMALEAMKLALASLEADPVAFRSKLQPPSAIGSERWDYTDHRQPDAFELENCVIERLYTAPPAPVSVPAAMEMDDDFDSAFEHGKAVGWNAYRAAMLQGSDGTLTNEGTITATQFKPVADLYGLTSPTGGETSFTFDAVEARDFIDGGWSCQEYVELERFQEAITNHTEDKLAMVDHSGDSNNMVEPVTTACELRDAVDAIRNSGIAIDGEKILAERDALNSPVTPDGWVACSEQMPEIGIKVLCFPVNDEPIHATYNGQVWLQDISWSASDEPIDNVISCNVFHWMPLPAAPQQEA